jgi:hypothetical protein
METKASLSSRSIQFHIVAIKWASDLNFFKIETAFFHRLLEDYFKESPATLTQVGTDAEKLRVLDAEIHKAEIKLGLQVRWIELMAEDLIPEDTGAIAAEQVRLEKLMADLTLHFRELKMHLFGLVEGVLTVPDLSVS